MLQSHTRFEVAVPVGWYLVDADALRQARQGVPSGEYH